MTGVILTLRASLHGPVDASGLALDRFGECDANAIARLEVRAGRALVTLGDLFTIRGGRSTSVRFEGSLGDVHGLGAGLSTGELIIDGDCGDRVGAGMTGGRISVVGNVGDDAGMSLHGGTLRISGDAGDRLGAAGPGARRGMSGGEIIVGGSVGNEAGMRARRGLIVIGGSTGGNLARDIIAGTVVVFGRVGDGPGRGSKRGSLVAMGGVEVPPTYRLACTFRPTFVRLLMTYLERQFGLQVGDQIMQGRYRRYCGDAGLPGKGEILEWIPS